MNLSKQTNLNIKNNEKSDYINFIYNSIYDTNAIALELQSQHKYKSDILISISKMIFDISININSLTLELDILKKQINDDILNIYQYRNKKILENIKDQIIINNTKIEIEKAKQDSLLSSISNIQQELTNLNIQIQDHNNYMHILSELNLLIPYREIKSDLKINNLLVCPEGLKDFVEAYKNPDMPNDLLDKVVFLKGAHNSGRHSVIKALGNELNRPIFRVKYEDYFNDYGLYNIFITLTSYIREQSNIKNENIENYNETINQIELIKSGNMNSVKDIVDIEGNIYNINIFDKEGKKEALSILKNDLAKIKEYINDSEDSCILCLDNLDKIIGSSKYDKGDLLGPIKSVIDDIKNEDHNIILILMGDNLGSNNNPFKSGIDKVFKLRSINDDYINIFNKILKEYNEKFNLAINIPYLEIKSLENEYKNIKFLDKLAKRVCKKVLENGEISQTGFDQELYDLIESDKSLYNGIGVK